MAGSATAACNLSDSTADHRAARPNRKVIVEIGIPVAKKLEIRGLHIGGIQLYDDPHRPMLPVFLGNRLTVDPRTLTPLVLVRIQVPQPKVSQTKTDGYACSKHATLVAPLFPEAVAPGACSLAFK